MNRYVAAKFIANLTTQAVVAKYTRNALVSVTHRAPDDVTVIVGSGFAGYYAAEKLRPQTDLIAEKVVDSFAYHAYDKSHQ